MTTLSTVVQGHVSPLVFRCVIQAPTDDSTALQILVSRAEKETELGLKLLPKEGLIKQNENIITNYDEPHPSPSLSTPSHPPPLPSLLVSSYPPFLSAVAPPPLQPLSALALARLAPSYNAQSMS